MIYALRSQEESQGIALVEGMAAGLPVVSTRVGGILYVINDGIMGLLSDYGDFLNVHAKYIKTRNPFSLRRSRRWF